MGKVILLAAIYRTVKRITKANYQKPAKVFLWPVYPAYELAPIDASGVLEEYGLNLDHNLILGFRGSWQTDNKHQKVFQFERIERINPATLAKMDPAGLKTFAQALQQPKPLLYQKEQTTVIETLWAKYHWNVWQALIDPVKLAKLAISEKQQRRLNQYFRDVVITNDLALFLLHRNHNYQLLYHNLKLHQKQHAWKRLLKMLATNPYQFWKYPHWRAYYGFVVNNYRTLDYVWQFYHPQAEQHPTRLAALSYIFSDKMIQQTNDTMIEQTNLIKVVQKYCHENVSPQAVRQAWTKQLPQMKLYQHKQWIAPNHYFQQAQMIAERCRALRQQSTETKLEISQTDPRFNEEQTSAIQAAIHQGLSIITGGPGTGKTTITQAILQQMQQHYHNEAIKIVAPTGKASYRIRQVTEWEGVATIHLLKSYLTTHPDVIVKVLMIDEMSMVTPWLLASIFTVCPALEKLILIGDVNQLPSIEPGNLFANLIALFPQAVTRLTIVYRQKNASDLIPFSHYVLQNENPRTKFDQTANEDIDYHDLWDATYIRGRLLQLCSRYQLTDFYEKVQIVTNLYQGDLGIHRLNYLIQQKVNKHHQPMVFGEQKRAFRLGDKNHPNRK